MMEDQNMDINIDTNSREPIIRGTNNCFQCIKYHLI